MSDASRSLGENDSGHWLAWLTNPVRRVGSRVAVALRALTGREEQRVISGVPWDVGGMPSDVTSVNRALSLVPVYAATKLLADMIATLPLQAYRKLADGIREEVELPKFLELTDYTGASAQPGTVVDWIHRCMTSLLLRGNAYGLITSRDRDGYPTNIIWLHPDCVDVQDQNMSGPGSYTQPIWYYQGRVVPKEMMLHIPWYTIPGKVQGLSPIEVFATTIGVGLATQDYGKRWFDAGGAPTNVFKNGQGELTKEQRRQIAAEFQAKIRSGKPLVLDTNWEYEAISVSPNEAQFIETMRLSATQIAAIYGVPPELIGGETASSSLTYQNVEQRAIAFSVFNLRTWCVRLESAFYPLMAGQRYVRFNLDALVRSDLAGRYASYKIARDIGLMSIDELRAIEDLKPLPGGKGKSYTPLAVMTKAGTDAEGDPVPQPAPRPAPQEKAPVAGAAGKLQRVK